MMIREYIEVLAPLAFLAVCLAASLSAHKRGLRNTARAMRRR